METRLEQRRLDRLGKRLLHGGIGSEAFSEAPGRKFQILGIAPNELGGNKINGRRRNRCDSLPICLSYRFRHRSLTPVRR
jgi:hypothetical protein